MSSVVFLYLKRGRHIRGAFKKWAESEESSEQWLPRDARASLFTLARLCVLRENFVGKKRSSKRGVSDLLALQNTTIESFIYDEPIA